MATAELDTIIANIAPDEISGAAGRLIDDLQGHYLPIIEEAQQLVRNRDIPSDPVAQGLQSFNEMIAALRGDANRVSDWLAQLNAEKRRAQARTKSARTAYDEQIARSLSQDPDILAIDGQQQKLAAAKEKHRREARIVSYADQIYTMVLGYHEAIKLVFDTLADTKRDLMSQLAVVKQRIALGEISGNQFPITRGFGPPTNRQQEMERELARDLPAGAGQVEV